MPGCAEAACCGPSGSRAPLLSRLLRSEPDTIRAGDVAGWWRQLCERRPGGGAPIDDAVLAGFLADRVGFAFAGAYQAALRALVPALPAGVMASFCVTEAGGNQPAAIESRLTPRPGGGFRLDGSKRWSTMAPLAGLLLVVAAEGTDDRARKRLRLAQVDAAAGGVTIASMPPPAFVPEVPHAEITLHGVEVGTAALLPGDAYVAHVKPFRTVEDVYVHAGLLGYVLSVARRYRFPREITERVVASLVATHALAALDAAAAEVHVAVAGLLAQDAWMLDQPAWTAVDEGERQRWHRDRALFSVAGKIREQRRRRAWEALASPPAAPAVS
jgi:alkylation response protein AidB-like acyl-CoA dehydrogenase